MRELTFDDALWRDALGALRAPGSAVARLGESWPGYAELVEELSADAIREPCLIGGRPSTAGKNPRLFLLLTAALLAREGVETLYLDLSPELRWLEMLLGEDLKEGLVDHLQYAVPIERCVRSTALPGLSVLTGGAHFLAGSPLEDAPAFRAALEALRKRFAAVVAAFPHPFDAAESAGVQGLCEAWIAIEEADAQASLSGSERAVVHLSGDPQAAWDLARLSSVFLGPLPALLAGPGGRPAAREAKPEAVEDDEELEFLRAFEASGPPPRDRSVEKLEPEAEPSGPATGSRRREAPAATGTSGRGRWMVVAVVTATLLIAVVTVGMLGGWFEPPFTDSDPEAGRGVWGAPSSPVEGNGTVVPLDVAVDSVAEAEPAPFSLHVGSYRSAESASRAIRRLEEAGQTALVAPVDLGEKGRWYRVYAGAFGDSASAVGALERILGAEVVEEGAVRRTPWAFRVSVHPDREAAEDALAALAEDGVGGYVVGDAPAVVWAGAFRSEEEAATLAEELEENGVEATLAMRESP